MLASGAILWFFTRGLGNGCRTTPAGVGGAVTMDYSTHWEEKMLGFDHHQFWRTSCQIVTLIETTCWTFPMLVPRNC